MKIWKRTRSVINAIESGLRCLAGCAEMVVDNDQIYFIVKEVDGSIKYIYALEDYYLDKQYPDSYKPEKEGEYPIVQDAHFNPNYVGFETKGMSITEIIKKYNDIKSKYENYN